MKCAPRLFRGRTAGLGLAGPVFAGRGGNCASGVYLVKESGGAGRMFGRHRGPGAEVPLR